MTFKKIAAPFVLTAAVVLCLAGCGRNKMPDSSSPSSYTTDSVKYKDGEYIASAPNYDDQGFMPTVKVIVKEGRIQTIDCDALAKEGDSKKVQSENGKYSMKAGGAKYEWHQQIAYFEKFVVENGVDKVRIKSDEKTDVITGCTIKVKDYKDLIKQALDKAKM